MIVGHIGAAYAAKRVSPRSSLAMLMIATFAPDILREILLYLEVPFFEANLYSHASPWCLELSLVCGFLVWLVTSDRISGVTATLVAFSHIPLDAISGHKLLWYWGPHGLNLERWWQYNFLLQVTLLLGGWYLIRHRPAPRWATNAMVIGALILGQFALEMGEISARPWLRRCLAYPFAQCTDTNLFTTKWAVTPFW
jgi:hypothetical protein